MKTINRNIGLFLFTCILLFSCKDIIEPDISKKEIAGMAPANNSVLSDFNLTFRWDLLENANKYHLQIVSPSFASPVSFIADTLITKNTFSIVLSSGAYQWRVRAENNAGHTEYFTYSLTVDSAINLKNQAVTLSLPANNSYVKSMSTTFSWQQLKNADSYLIQITSPSSVMSTQTSTSNSLDYSFTSQGTYTWRVLAQNATSITQPSTTYTVTVDTTKPVLPTPVSPATASTTTLNPIPLVWNTNTVSTYDKTDFCRIQISTDSTFNSVTTKDVEVAATTSPVTYNFEDAVIGQKYFWRVKARDNANNESSYTTPRSIKRN